MAYSRIRTRYDASPGQIKAFLASGALYTTYVGSRIGTDQVVMDSLPIKKPKFRPGTFRVGPCDMRKFKAACSSSSLTKYYKGVPEVTITGPIASMYGTNPGDTSTGWNIPTGEQDRTLCRAYSKLTQPDVDYGMFLAELPQLASLLTSPLKTIVKLATPQFWSGMRQLATFPLAQINDAVRSNCKKLPTIVSSAWLTYRYGIRPAIMDFNAIIAQIRANEKVFIKLRSKAARVSVTQPVSQTIQKNVDWQSWFTWDVEHCQYQSSFTTSHVYFLYTRLLGGTGFSLSDVPNLLWELTPWSFVLDWWFDVGTFLRAVQNHPPGLSFLGNCVSSKSEILHTTRLCSVRTLDYYTGVWRSLPTPSIYSVKLSKLTRSVNLPLPGIPPVSYAFENVTHVFDSLSLIWQKMPIGSKRNSL